jgi:hypothetical protein
VHIIPEHCPFFLAEAAIQDVGWQHSFAIQSWSDVHSLATGTSGTELQPTRKTNERIIKNFIIKKEKNRDVIKGLLALMFLYRLP